MEEVSVHTEETNNNWSRGWSENDNTEEETSKSICLSNVNVVVDQIASEMKCEKVQSLADLAYAKLSEQPQEIASPSVDDATPVMQQVYDDSFNFEGIGVDDNYTCVDPQENAFYQHHEFFQQHQAFLYDQNYDPEMTHPCYVYPYQMITPAYSEVPGICTEVNQSAYKEIDLGCGSPNHVTENNQTDEYNTTSDMTSQPLWYQYIDQEGRPSTTYNVNAPVFYPSSYTQSGIPEAIPPNDHPSEFVQEVANEAYCTETQEVPTQQIQCDDEHKNDSKHGNLYTRESEIMDVTREFQHLRTQINDSHPNDEDPPNQNNVYTSTATINRVDKTRGLPPVKFGAVDLGRSCHENTQFQYPSIYVSDSGLITLLLKNDVSMEMTVDMAIRLVSHQNQLVVATNNSGTATFLSHPFAKIAQDTDSIEADIFKGRKAKLTKECVTFANESECFVFDDEMIDFECDLELANLVKDNSIEYLFQSAKLGSDIVPQCVSLISQADYRLLNKGGFVVKINGMKITQTGRGDVSVLCGPKYLRISPGKKQLTVQTRSVDISITSNSVVEINKQFLSLYADQIEMQLSNEKIEAGFDPENNAYACSLPDMRSLPIGRRRQHARIPINRLRQRRRNLSRECNYD
ncbi:hypothetical protein FSP39_011972 [Pinctada imbricata]|uniref:Uncharacterized protein n=1 Tax=Pinctada imbricata TaxID=66713 RepID=A0AA89C7D4_PINIB|nr:hypothetical protein FSP39_011972 [Pinctada imbricata]